MMNCLVRTLVFVTAVVVTAATQLKSQSGEYQQWIATIDEEFDCDHVTEQIKSITHKHYHKRRLLGETLGTEPHEVELKSDMDCYVMFEGNDDTANQVYNLIDGVEEVEPNEQIVGDVTWNIDRIDQTALPLDNQRFAPPFTGKGQDVYVLDTGIYKDHNEFDGTRAVYGTEIIPESSRGDLHGHGTHCASTAVGTKYGVARDAKAIGVKVLSAQGYGSTAGVIEGIQWVVNKAGNKASVLSMSLGGSFHSAQNRAVENAAKRHIVVVAAGNQNNDACFYSPASAQGKVITVGSTTSNDARSSFSNHGKCVDIWAPGSSILAAGIKSRSDTATMSGTSMATPHVAGVAAILLEKNKGDVAQTYTELFAITAPNQVKDVKTTPSNLFLQIPTYTGPPTNAPTQPPNYGEPVFQVNKRNVKHKPSTFGPEINKFSIPIEAEIARSTTNLCTRTTQQFTSKVALVERGGCDFSTKVLNAQDQGAVAVVISQDSRAVPFNPGCSVGCTLVTIPSTMVSKNDGKKMDGTLFWGGNGSVVRPKCKRTRKKRRCEKKPQCGWKQGKCKANP